MGKTFKDWSNETTTLVRVNRELKKKIEEIIAGEKKENSIYYHVNKALINYIKQITQ